MPREFCLKKDGRAQHYMRHWDLYLRVGIIQTLVYGITHVDHTYLIACCLFISVYKYTGVELLKALIILNIICQTKPAANSALLKNLQ